MDSPRPIHVVEMTVRTRSYEPDCLVLCIPSRCAIGASSSAIGTQPVHYTVILTLGPCGKTYCSEDRTQMRELELRVRRNLKNFSTIKLGAGVSFINSEGRIACPVESIPHHQR